MAETKIEWAHYTFNPWEGCVNISPACDGCYAQARDIRLHHAENWGKDALRLFHVDSYWKQPAKWNREAEAAGEIRNVFVGSLCDIMEDRRDLDAPRDRVFALFEVLKWLNLMLVTKRPQNFRRLLPKRWTDAGNYKQNFPTNVWGIVTVESPEYEWRIAELLKFDFAVCGVSYEPALAAVNFAPWMMRAGLQPNGGIGYCCQKCGRRVSMSRASADVVQCTCGAPKGYWCGSFRSLNWLIAGGESEQVHHKARPSHPDWFRGARDQAEAARVAFLFKQWGQWRPRDGEAANAGMICLTDKAEDSQILVSAGENPVWMESVGKRISGRLLDGKEWNGIPEARVCS
jgi:protein gp37